MAEIRKLEAQEERVENGPVQFGSDWPGVFLRGDSAAYYALNLKMYLDGKDRGVLCQLTLEGLVKTLAGCIVGPSWVKEALEEVES